MNNCSQQLLEDMARVTLYRIAIGAEQSGVIFTPSIVIFGVAVTLRRFSCSHAIFLRSSSLHCRALLQSGTKVYCLLILNFIVSKRSISDSCGEVKSIQKEGRILISET